MSSETCPLCARQKARRACPALERRICPVCCGTKRLVDISCPADCAYLATARTHPASVVRRRQARDLAFLEVALRDLSDHQRQLWWALQQRFVHARRRASLAALVDRDVVEAAQALAATLETAARGIFYEHQPQTVNARRLAAELRELLDGAHRDRRIERDALVVLRRIEQTAGHAAASVGDSPTAYLDFVERMLRLVRPPASGLLIPRMDRSL